MMGTGGEPPVTPPPKTEHAKTHILKPITGDNVCNPYIRGEHIGVV